MAEQVKRREPILSTYGNVAYDHTYAPGRQDRSQGYAEPTIRAKERRIAAKARVNVRQAGYVAPTAVLGFLVVAVLAVMLLASYAKVAKLSDQIVELRRDESTLAEEHTRLVTEYELAFDLKSVEEQVTASGLMVQPQPGQVVTLNISEPDSARIYQEPGAGVGQRLWQSIAETINNLVAFLK